MNFESINTGPYLSILIYSLLVVTQLLFIVRVTLRPHRQPASRIAWVMVITLLPVLGIFIYILFGETNIGQKRSKHAREIIKNLPEVNFNYTKNDHLAPTVPLLYQRLFDTANSINGFETFGGNTAKLIACSDETISHMIYDIDQAREHVHVLFYIWLLDNNGCKMIAALHRAAGRGVKCRVMVDGLGSHDIIKSKQWKILATAGVHVAIALPIGNIFLKPFKGRIDLRNHRKIVVIDNKITYCGSQNCADAEFLVKKKFAPWVDVVMRFEGPVVSQQQRIFIADWLTKVDEDMSDILKEPVVAKQLGFSAQAFATGPTARNSAMPDIFESLMFAAIDEIIISTPYFVPDESIQSAICIAALRGVKTTLIFPAKNDSFIVAAASHSYYLELLKSGVKIYEYVGGLLHAKTFTIDGKICLIGSANMDRRSFDLNYENNILLYDENMAQQLRALQAVYISKSIAITLEDVMAWPLKRRLWNNSVAMLGPLL